MPVPMTERSLIVAPSLLACDFGKLAEEIARIETAGADWLHLDVMDGHFVPNLTIGPVVVAAIRRVTQLPLDVHLMIEEPQKYIQSFVEAGSDALTVHVEASALKEPSAMEETLQAIRSAGVRVGISLRPATAAEAVKPYLDKIDSILVMTVEPGFGGQAFITEVVPKIRKFREWFSGDIAVDGGINAQTGAVCREAGANVFIAGTYVFRAESPKQAIQVLRG